MIMIYFFLLQTSANFFLHLDSRTKVQLLSNRLGSEEARSGDWAALSRTTIHLGSMESIMQCRGKGKDRQTKLLSK